MIFIVFIMKCMPKTKPPMNGIFTPNIGGFTELKTQSSMPKDNFLKYCNEAF